MEVCTYRTCRRKMPCPPTGVSPSTSTAGRRGRATAPASPSQVSPCGRRRGRGAGPVPGRGPSPARCPLPFLPPRAGSAGTATSGPRSQGTSRSGAGGAAGAARGSGSARAVPPSPQPPSWPGAAVAVPRVTPSGRRRGGRRCDVTARDVSSLTRCDEHASDTAAEAVQSGVPGVSGRSRLRSLPKLLRSAGREGGSSPGSQPLSAALPLLPYAVPILGCSRTGSSN